MPNREPAQSARVDVSVLIATRDNAGMLRATLGHLARQRLDGLSWEVLVVDNGSTDDTPAVLASAVDSDLPLRALTEPLAGKNRALNRALPVAKGNLLVFTDDDVIPDVHWVRRLQEASIRWSEDSIFGGPILPRFPAGTPGWIAAVDFEYASIAYGRFSPRQDEGPIEQAPFGANLALRRSLFAEFSFDVTIGPSGQAYAQGSEYELTRRLNANGHRNIFVPDAPVEHVIRPNQVDVDWLLQRAFRFGRGSERIEPSLGRLTVASVPVRLWWKFGWSRLARALGRPLPSRQRFATAKQHAYLSGRIFECRQAARSHPSRKASP